MDLDEPVRRRLMDAGGAALERNAPMSASRAHDAGRYLAAAGETMLDLGSGAGWLVCETLRQHPHLSAIGIDVDEAALGRANSRAAELGIADRVRFELSDASRSAYRADAVVCIGASHAFGGPEPMFRAMRERAGSAAVVGDGFWQREPTAALTEMLGEMPRGVDALACLAEQGGWSVVDTQVSTLDEWDRFERGWGDGVRSVGTPEARAFAESRWAEYQTYRGILGFGWLYLAADSSG